MSYACTHIDVLRNLDKVLTDLRSCFRCVNDLVYLFLLNKEKNVVVYNEIIL